MSVLLIAEHNNSNLKVFTLNAISAASKIDADVHVLVAGNKCENVAKELSAVPLVKKVLSLKGYKKEIIDKKRISVVLKRIRKESLKKNIDPKITRRIWKNMIWSYIDFEKRNFKKK